MNGVEPGGPSGPRDPLSWRDVYKAVGDSEERIINVVRSTVEPLSISSADHDRRLREIEIGGSPHARALEVLVTAQEIRLRAAETALLAGAVRDKGLMSALSATQRFVLLLVAVGGLVFAFGDFLSRVGT